MGTSRVSVCHHGTQTWGEEPPGGHDLHPCRNQSKADRQQARSCGTERYDAARCARRSGVMQISQPALNEEAHVCKVRFATVQTKQTKKRSTQHANTVSFRNTFVFMCVFIVDCVIIALLLWFDFIVPRRQAYSSRRS